MVALEVLGDFAEVGKAPVGAAADEGDVDLGAFDGRAGLELHVVERLLDGGAVGVVVGIFEARDGLVDGDPLVWADPPGDARGDVGGVDVDDVVVFAVGVGGDVAPFFDRGVPPVPLGRIRAAFEVFESFVVGVDVTCACAALDGHVADGHALFHGGVVDEAAAVLVGVADAAFGT